MKRLIYILIISICLFPNLIKGSECTNEQRERLQKFADNVTYTLEEYEENGEIYFKVTFTGLSKELRIYNDRRYFYYYNYSNNPIDEISINVYPETIYQFEVNGSNTCLYKNLRTITINIPSFNKYYSDPKCNDARNLNICQKWAKVDLLYDEFIKKVDDYKEKQKENMNVPSDKKEENNDIDFLALYNKYYWPTFAGMICLLILLVILWIRENKKNRL